MQEFGHGVNIVLVVVQAQVLVVRGPRIAEIEADAQGVNVGIGVEPAPYDPFPAILVGPDAAAALGVVEGDPGQSLVVEFGELRAPAPAPSLPPMK